MAAARVGARVWAPMERAAGAASDVLGPLSVQSQDYCANGGASTYRSRSKSIFDQYRFKFVTK